MQFLLSKYMFQTFDIDFQYKLICEYLILVAMTFVIGFINLSFHKHNLSMSLYEVCAKYINLLDVKFKFCTKYNFFFRMMHFIF